MSDLLLKVNDLKTYFYSEKGEILSVNGVSFEVKNGETVALVGESGSGKSVTSLSIMGLIESPGKILNGEIIFDNTDLRKMSENEVLKMRGKQMSMIFQEPLSSLNPVFTIGNQIMEMIQRHNNLNKKENKRKVISLLHKVGIPNPEKVYNMYPHSLSGGMRQRVMIAMALSCNPKLLIADEPTTALDVTIQAQILRLMKDLKKDYSTSILIITHDFGVVAEIADRVVVMYAGQVVEKGNVYEIFRNPKHPYTQGLLNSTIKIDQSEDKLDIIKGVVPPPHDLPSGCAFNPRCPFATEKCVSNDPPEFEYEDNHTVKCWLHQN